MSGSVSRVSLSVTDGVRSWARRTPGALAVRHGERELGYRELVERIDRLGNVLVAGLGIRPGDRLAVLSPNCLEYVELTLGIADARAAGVLVSPTSQPAELEYLCNDSESRVLFVHPTLEEVARAAHLETVEQIVVMGDEYERRLTDARPRRVELERSDADAFLLLYTSGSTGRPKGIVMSQRAKIVQFFGYAAELGVSSPAERTLVVRSFSHGGTLPFAAATLAAGGACIVMPIFHPEVVLRQITANAITTAPLIPTHLGAILELGAPAIRRHDLRSLRRVSSTGAPLTLPVKERFVEAFGDRLLYDHYGLTETALVAVLRPEDQLRRHGSVGQPFHTNEVKIVGDGGTEAAIGETGLLHVRSPQLFDGYWKRPEQTAAAFRDGSFVTGDLGHVDADGYVTVLGRADGVIISGGLNVDPAEVETVLLAHPDVEEAAVFGVPDDLRGNLVGAAVVLRAGSGADERELLGFVAPQLSSEKRPRRIDVVEQLPRTANGKLDRVTLRERYRPRA